MTAPKQPEKSAWDEQREAAYNAGMAVGFAAAVDLVRILGDPSVFIARADALEREFGNSIRAILGDEGSGRDDG